ncbi:MAG: DoxX family protein [Mycobacterium sp.]
MQRPLRWRREQDLNNHKNHKNLIGSLNRYSPAVLSLFRFVYGLLFAMSGSMHLFDWPVALRHPVEAGSPVWFAGIIELVTGLLIAAGLFTRAAAFIASGHMAVAYFWIHQPIALWPVGEPPGGNGGTEAILFCFGFFLLVFTGPGVYSIDARRRSIRPSGSAGRRFPRG